MTDPYGEEVRTTTTTTAYDPATAQEVRSATVTRRIDGSNPLVWVLAVIAILAIIALVYMFVQANNRDELTAEQAALAAQNAALQPVQPYDASSAAFDQSVAAAQAANLANQAAAANASNSAMNQAAMTAAQQASADRAAAAADRAAAERAADEARAAASSARTPAPVVISPAPDTSGAVAPEPVPPS